MLKTTKDTCNGLEIVVIGQKKVKQPKIYWPYPKIKHLQLKPNVNMGSQLQWKSLEIMHGL